jgi:hypothetical protein
MHYFFQDPAIIAGIKGQMDTGLEKINQLASRLGNDVRLLLTSDEEIRVRGIFLKIPEKPRIPGFIPGKRNIQEGEIQFQEWITRDGVQGKETQEILDSCTHTNPASALLAKLTERVKGTKIPSHAKGYSPFCLIPENYLDFPMLVRIPDPKQQEFISKHPELQLEPAFSFQKPPEAEQALSAIRKAETAGGPPSIFDEENPIIEEVASDNWAILTQEGEGSDLTQTLQIGGHSMLKHGLDILKEKLNQANWLVIHEEETQFEAVR